MFNARSRKRLDVNISLQHERLDLCHRWMLRQIVSNMQHSFVRNKWERVGVQTNRPNANDEALGTPAFTVSISAPRHQVHASPQEPLTGATINDFDVEHVYH
jgi:hypothetical protein